MGLGLYGFPKIRATISGVPVIKTAVFGGLYRFFFWVSRGTIIGVFMGIV